MKFTNALGGCANCGALTSPCWRKGPEEARHLCNACGSRYLVKGTLEGYKPGVKSRTGGKRPKSNKSKAYQNNSTFAAHMMARAESPQKRLRLFKDNSLHSHRAYADKGIQVNLRELRGMPAFTRTLSMDDASDEAYLLESSPKYHFSRVKRESLNGFEDVDEIPDKYSSDESSPEAEAFTPTEKGTVRKRARKPCRPTVSTW